MTDFDTRWRLQVKTVEFPSCIPKMDVEPTTAAALRPDPGPEPAPNQPSAHAPGLPDAVNGLDPSSALGRGGAVVPLGGCELLLQRIDGGRGWSGFPVIGDISIVGFGCPRDVYRGVGATPGVFRELAQVLLDAYVDFIVGPALSGAQLAFAAASAGLGLPRRPDGGMLKPLYSPKEGYAPRKHNAKSLIHSTGYTICGNSRLPQWVWIDDLICSGEAYEESICWLLQHAQFNGPNGLLVPPLAIISGSTRDNLPVTLLTDVHRGCRVAEALHVAEERAYAEGYFVRGGPATAIAKWKAQWLDVVPAVYSISRVTRWHSRHMLKSVETPPRVIHDYI